MLAMGQAKDMNLPASREENSPKGGDGVATSLSNKLTRLSISNATTTALTSSPAPGPAESSSPSTPKIRRTPSATSLSTRSMTPTLRKRTSLSSIQGGGSTPPKSPGMARRTSSNFFGNGVSQNTIPSIEEQPAMLTASAVGQEYLERDLKEHGSDTSQIPVTVILHDACYGHRYSRPRTSKAALGSVVERPERILATVLGISAAYVRLGGRHAAGNNAPHPKRNPGKRPFTVQKSTRSIPLTSPAVTQVHGTDWMAELKSMCEGAEAKLALNGKELVRPDKADGGKPKLHDGDLYLCSDSLNALEGCLGGVLDAVDAAFSSPGPRRSFACVRPPGHHCSNDYPSGFCWLNNVHVGISHAAKTYGLTHAAIIDFDLHHGDGSQAITWAHNDKARTLPKNTPISKKAAIGYFSLHDINSYPCEMGDEEKVRNASICIENAHGQSIWNVHLQPWRTDAEFWELYETRYVTLLDKTRAFLKSRNEKLRSLGQGPQPKAAIFVSAGFDASEWESQGMQRHQVNVPTDFYARFTRDIVDLSMEDNLGLDGKIISVLEGGYSDRALTSGVLSHMCGLAASNENASIQTLSGLGQDMNRRLGKVDMEAPKDNREAVDFDSKWWSPSQLEELEKLVNPPPAVLPRKPRGPVAPTYATPTQSFTAKIVSPTSNRRASNPISRQRVMSCSSDIRPASPIPVDVDWATAARELSKLLIPKDRSTTSCKSEDLNAEATRARRIRQSTVELPEGPVEDGKRMQLRDRKAKPSYKGSDEEISRPASKATNRRTTIAGAAELEAISGAGTDASRSKSRRRVSAASSVLSNSDTMPTTSMEPSDASLPIKKTRSPTRARPKKAQPPVSRIPSATSSAAPTEAKPKASTPTSGGFQASTAATIPAESELDKLTSGVKKMSIKLNVPSKEEHDAREAKKGVPVKSARKTTAAKPAKETKSQSKAAAKNDSKTGRKVQLSEQKPAGIDDGQVTTQTTGTDISHVTAQTASEGQMLPPAFLPPEPAAIPAPTANPMTGAPVLPEFSAPITATLNAQEPPKQPEPPKRPDPLPASEAASVRPQTPKRTKADLPVFTSTSPIMFGPPKLDRPGQLPPVEEQQSKFNAADADRKESKDTWAALDAPQE